jgi:hypothetical protein
MTPAPELPAGGIVGKILLAVIVAWLSGSLVLASAANKGDPMVNALIWIIIMLAVLAGVAYIAKWIIEGFLPEPARTPALLIVGVVLLILLILGAAQLFGGGGLSLGPSPFHR